MSNDGTSFWTTFMPHGHCYQWRADILWLNVISDTFIALAYFSIPLGLYFVLRRRPDTPYRPLIVMFSLFILACGLTHVVSIWTVWHGNYGFHGITKGITAIISMATAVMLVPLLPKITSVKSPEELHALNLELLKEIKSQKASAESLKRTESKFRSFLQLAPDGILIVRSSGMIEYSNDMVNSMFGRPAGDLTGKYVNELLPERSHAKISATHNDLFETDGSLWTTQASEFYGIRKDGTEFPVEIRINPIFHEEDDTVTLSTLRDITQRKVREEKERKELLRVANTARLSTVGQMAAGLAHELNQPLTAISNNLHTAMSMQKKKADPDPELYKMMRENYESAQRAGQIIKSLRQLVRKDDGNRRAINISELVKSTTELIKPEARIAGVSLNLELGKNLPTSWLDPIQIQQVLVNLGRNAIEELRDQKEHGAKITIKTSRHNKHTLMVSVSDNGSGLSPEVKEALFKPYVTTKETGMGLGLSICRTIIEGQDGQLWYEDEPSGGAVFCFTLPIYKAAEKNENI